MDPDAHIGAIPPVCRRLEKCPDLGIGAHKCGAAVSGVRRAKQKSEKFIICLHRFHDFFLLFR